MDGVDQKEKWEEPRMPLDMKAITLCIPKDLNLKEEEMRCQRRKIEH